jgi:hypothetical protein
MCVGVSIGVCVVGMMVVVMVVVMMGRTTTLRNGTPPRSRGGSQDNGSPSKFQF